MAKVFKLWILGPFSSAGRRAVRGREHLGKGFWGKRGGCCNLCFSDFRRGFYRGGME